MRIELLGPSGVGKSTILARAEELRATPATWRGTAETDALVPAKPSTAELRAAIDSPDLRELVDRCVAVVAGSPLAPSQKLGALTLLNRSCYRYGQVRARESELPVVHDELLLHRAFSLLVHTADPAREARWFFELVPAPDAAALFWTDVDTIVERVQQRGSLPNVYRGLDQDGLRDAVQRCEQVLEVAEEVLAARGVLVRRIDVGEDVEAGARELASFIATSIDEGAPTDHPGEDVSPEPAQQSPDEMAADIQERLLRASGSFRKKAGRHELRTRDVMYCAFSTPNFTIPPEVSQRDAARRVAHFRLDREVVEGRSVLDLGSNAGAMLFQVSNFAPASGLGIEYDVDKVDLANEIATFAEIPNLRFEQGDIDQLDAAKVGVHDIVFALAIESHVQDPARLYELLGEVTGDLLCFEGNHRCDMDDARARLEAAGFTDMVDLGFCDDDRDPRNNARPQLLARKKKATKRRWPWSR